MHLTLDAKGARIFRDVTRDNINKRMAILLFESSKGEVVTAPVIRGEIAGGQVQISGSMSSEEAADTALLLRAGALAAPMSIIEERTIGPSLGADNIAKGFYSTLYGFLAIAAFIILYYHLFGVFSTIGLTFNVLLLLALLSMLQATLTLPGIAAIALTLGMAIDSNVLINERIREELRAGASPQQAIHHGFERAWGTILDSNLTTLIVGLALLAFGSVRSGASPWLHCLGILTSMFSSVVGVRALAKPLVRPQEEAHLDLHRRGLETQDELNNAGGPAAATIEANHGILPDPPHHPFMRHALVLNVISLVTFLAAVFFIATRGFHLSIEFTGGTVMEVSYNRPRSWKRARRRLKLGYSDFQVQNFGTSRDDDPPAPAGQNVRHAERNRHPRSRRPTPASSCAGSSSSARRSARNCCTTASWRCWSWCWAS